MHPFDLAAKSRKKRKIVTTQVDRLKVEVRRLKTVREVRLFVQKVLNGLIRAEIYC